ncbi:MAG TPA: helicase-related protein, partial [Pseudidiomarina sp.]|nr:helicase-related protein [Pseudidiomarina sp.]
MSDTATSYAVGQRWLSETETEQGLGLITQVSGRLLTILFPATDEVRHYAAAEAPLARYQLLADEQGQHADGWYFRVTDVIQQKGINTYIGLREDNQESVRVPEPQLSAQVAVNHPMTRLLAGKTDRLDMYRLRQAAQHHLQAWQQSQVAGLLGARVNLLPHQLYIADQLADRYQPRVMLADEVGLGKTIEAGYIIQRRLLSGRSQRVIIVVPDALTHQWIIELQRRFALRFSLFDEERCEQAALDGGDVFASEQLILIPQSLLRHAVWGPALTAVDWDLLVVDEAHQLHPEQPHFALVRELCQVTAGVLLLTATPEQAGAEAHFARLQLLDPDRFFDHQAFVTEQQRYHELAPLVGALADAKGETDPLNATQIDALATFMQRPLSSDTLRDPATRATLLDELLDMHGTGRVMFRNARAHVGGFPERHLVPHALSDEAAAIDWLHQLLKQQRPDKFILICRSTAAALDLAEQLRIRFGLHAAVFHEGLSVLERDRAAAFFASPEDGCPLLICSEIGSEGRNFQFAHHLILFDLPEHPDLLEQRIGRLDRIGQQLPVQVHVPYIVDSASEVWFRWYAAMAAFTAPNAVGDALYGAFVESVRELAEQVPLDAMAVEQLALATEDQAAALRAEVAQGRDRLQELNAFRPEPAQAIVKRIETFIEQHDLEAFMQDFWARFGVDYDELNAASGWLRPTEQLRTPLADLPEEGITVTFSREYALAHEDVILLSWDHPHVHQALELLTEDAFGSTCVALLQNRALPPGTWFLELTFSSRAVAPRELAVQEFYPRQAIRVLLDSQGRELSQKVPAASLDKQLQFMDKKQARLIIKQLRPALQ